MNPMQLMTMLRNGGNIESVARELAKNSNNPVINNLIKQIDSANKEEVNNIINNLMQQNGMQDRINQIANLIGLKKA